MISKQISPAVFFVSDSDLGIIYSPKDRIVMEVKDFKPEVINSPQFKNFIEQNFKNSREPFPQDDLFSFTPTKTTLFLSSDCNSRCTYCYSDAGTRKINLPIEPAKAAIDFVISNALKQGSDVVKLIYHGGGEPTINWNVLVESHNYFKKMAEEKRLNANSGISTNGAVSRDKMEWLARNLSFIQVSFDGPPHIQNRQRPLAGNKPSYHMIRPNLELLKNYGVNFALRATVTREGLPELSSIVEHLTDLSGDGRVHLEPVASEWGRCLSSGCASPCDSEFNDAFIQA
ncbi:4Fe-4S cluster-binding domain-containing protein [Candidatus Woesearchaeota archaeon]|nr:4Fe-4S cluster-binding domain-containing protein [Candidatus Woesearchaeota archaeon]